MTFPAPLTVEVYRTSVQEPNQLDHLPTALQNFLDNGNIALSDKGTYTVCLYWTPP